MFAEQQCEETFQTVEAELFHTQKNQEDTDTDLITDKARIEAELATLKTRQLSLCEDTQAKHSLHQQTLLDLRKQYKEACLSVKEEMKSDSEHFRLYTEKHNTGIQVCEMKLKKNAKQRLHLQKQKHLLADRMAATNKLFNEYKQNAKRLAENYSKIVRADKPPCASRRHTHVHEAFPHQHQSHQPHHHQSRQPHQSHQSHPSHHHLHSKMSTYSDSMSTTTDDWVDV